MSRIPKFDQNMTPKKGRKKSTTGMPPKGSDCYALLLLLMMTAFPAAFSL